MLPKMMEAALNNQVKHELESAYSYLAMSAYCETKEYVGFARWLRLQAKEEVEHAMKFFDFINDRGGRVALQPIAQPKVEFETLVELFEAVQQAEARVTGLINELYELAVKDRDLASLPLLQWFITEQVGEEKSASETLTLVKRAGHDTAALLQLDKRLGERSGTD
jgi:ferritin